MKKKCVVILGLLMAVTIFLSGCAGSSKYMKETSGVAPSYKPEKTESLVIFMRPSGLGFAISSSVFDITEKEEVFVGIVPAKKKVAYKTNPGEHMFMVVGESADFMRANLEAGKTYYALVTPRMGVWKARFSLKPIHKQELNSDEFQNWFNSCDFVENTQDSYDWAKNNTVSIQSKKEEYLTKWNEKSDTDKPLLNSDDGL